MWILAMLLGGVSPSPSEEGPYSLLRVTAAAPEGTVHKHIQVFLRSLNGVYKFHGEGTVVEIRVPVDDYLLDKGSVASGLVENVPDGVSQPWIRLIPSYGGQSREARLDADGSFSFPIDPGFYVLAVIAGPGET